MIKKVFMTGLTLAVLIACSPTEQKQEAVKIKTYSQTTEIPEGITTPNEVETSIGTLKFIDGAPLPETSELVYENLDRMRGVDVFLKCIPPASLSSLLIGAEEIGGNNLNKVLIADELGDSKPLWLTWNTSTLYVTPNFDLKK